MASLGRALTLRSRARIASRWLLSVSLAVLLALGGPPLAIAQASAVPVSLQAELLAKVAEYDRNFVARARGRVHVLIVAMPGDADSMRVARQMETALKRLDRIGGLPHDESVYIYKGAADVAAVCRSRAIATVFFGPGLSDEVGAIRKALTGVDVLSVASNPADVARGIVLGFDVVSGRPKLLVHLPQAKLQNVALRSEILKLMRVFK